jgi:hypothetical protein
MHPPDYFRPTMDRLDGILGRLGVRYHLTGGLASIAYGDPRTTQDLDVVIDASAMARSFEQFLAAAEAEGFLIEPKVARDALSHGAMFQMLDRREIVKVDLYPRELIPGELDRSARIEVFEGVMLPIASRVDAAASKLIWISMGSHRSRRDLRRMLDQMSPEDRDRLHEISDRLQLASLLAEVIDEPEEPREAH